MPHCELIKPQLPLAFESDRDRGQRDAAVEVI